ncbi:MAG: sugar transferase [Microbacteriaceae bacterium]|nr:sugar transferase [Microbacteriaceae bacterium]
MEQHAESGIQGSGAASTPYPAVQQFKPSRPNPGKPLAHGEWEKRYARRLAITDLVVIVWAVAGAQIVKFGTDPAPAILDIRRYEFNLALSYTALSIVLAAAWMITLSIFGTRDSRVVGVGATEYKRIFDASLRLFGIVAIAAFLLHVDIARSYVLIAFPVGMLALMFMRWIWRQWLSSKRKAGQFTSRVILIGSTDTVLEVAQTLARVPHAGYLVVAAWVPARGHGEYLEGTTIPLLADIDSLSAEMELRAIDTVIVTSSDDFSPARIRRLSWSLTPGRQHLVVAPSITDIGGPRIHMRPVAGLPLVHVETPQYEGIKAFSKRTFDILVSGSLLLLLSPLMLVVAIAIRVTSPGPILYRAERVGYLGEPFAMLKFRSMQVGAERELASLLSAQGTAGTPLFKIRDDPRVTPLGGVLRKYSLDELPQLFNVLSGSMSLVGPRPQVDAEVALYDDATRRRLLLKPGMSGLWQVSGRSSLSWEDAIRLDLYYVENWSLTADIVILWKTIRAVVTPGQDAI